MTNDAASMSRELSADDLDAVSGGAVSVVNIGPIRIAHTDGMTSLGIRGVGQVVIYTGSGGPHVTTHPLQ